MNNNNLTLSQVIKKLQLFERLFGDIPVLLNIDDKKEYNADIDGDKYYKIDDILADEDNVIIYN